MDMLLNINVMYAYGFNYPVKGCDEESNNI